MSDPRSAWKSNTKVRLANDNLYLLFEGYTYRHDSVQYAEVTVSVRSDSDPNYPVGVVESGKVQVVDPVQGSLTHWRRTNIAGCTAHWNIDRPLLDAMKDFTVTATATWKEIFLEDTVSFVYKQMT